MFADVASAEIDGLQLCRAIKRSRRLAKTRVVITTSVVDSGQVSDEVLQRHAADGYIEKPIDPETFVLEVERVDSIEEDGMV